MTDKQKKETENKTDVSKIVFDDSPENFLKGYEHIIPSEGKDNNH